MPNRILKESITTSATIAALSAEEERFFYRVLVVCDDYGRMDGRVPVLRARCFPLLLDRITDKHVSRWLDAISKANLVQRYVVASAPFIQVATWERHQQTRAKRSKFPAQESGSAQAPSDDFICNQAPADSLATRYTRIDTRESLHATRTSGDRAAAPPDFEACYADYPRREGRAAALKAWLKLKPGPEIVAAIKAAIAWQRRLPRWLEEGGKYVPHFSTYLNNARWEDEPPMLPNVSGKTANNLANIAEWVHGNH